MKLKDYLKKHDISQSEFADTIGYNRMAFNRIVNGHYLPPAKTRLMIEKFTLGEVTINDWMISVKNKVDPNQLLLFSEGI